MKRYPLNCITTPVLTGYHAESVPALVASIRQVGLRSPILIRASSNSPNYEIVDGRKRFAACVILGHSHISAVECDFDDREALSYSHQGNVTLERFE